MSSPRESTHAIATCATVAPCVLGDGAQRLDEREVALEVLRP